MGPACVLSSDFVVALQFNAMDVARIQVELEKLLGVAVDVLTLQALPDKFRGAVLAEAVPV